MTQYEKVKTEVLALPATQKDGLLKELAAEHAKRKASEQAEKATGWKQKIWQAVAVIATALAALFGALACTGCTYTSSQVASDGATAQRVFAIDAATARDLVKLYGVPMAPVVNVGK